MSRGRLPSGDLPFELKHGPVKTYVIEVNGVGDASEAIERVARLAGEHELQVATTDDESLTLVWGESVGLVIDVQEPRFWRIHTTSPAGETAKVIKRAIWGSRDLDWCWFPVSFLRRLQTWGEPRWFQADFRGTELLPREGIDARHLRVQLEGDNATALFEVLLRERGYRHAASLTSVATTSVDDSLGRLDELTHYRGRFVGQGDSFDLHVGFVSRAIDRYGAIVREYEAAGLEWDGTEDGGWNVTGRTITMDLGRPIPSMSQFLTGLFSCRDPFRLWAVPRPVGADNYEAEVVDLHIGRTFRLEVNPNRLRLILPRHTCGNTVLRLLTNLQHRFDAQISTDGPDAPAEVHAAG